MGTQKPLRGLRLGFGQFAVSGSLGAGIAACCLEFRAFQRLGLIGCNGVRVLRELSSQVEIIRGYGLLDLGLRRSGVTGVGYRGVRQEGKVLRVLGCGISDTSSARPSLNAIAHLCVPRQSEKPKP